MSAGTAAAGPAPLPAGRLRVVIDPADLPFEDTSSCPPLGAFVGQDRAIGALRFGATIAGEGFNLYVAGPPGSGRRSAVRQVLAEAAAKLPPFPDWVHVNNFADPNRPRAMALPRGAAIPFRDAMAELVEDLAAGIPAAFEADDYKQRRGALEAGQQARQEERLAAIRDRAAAAGIALVRTPMGFAFVPARDGQIVKPEVFQTWPESERRAVQANVEGLQAALADLLNREVPAEERALRTEIRALDREVARKVTDTAIAEVARRFEGVAAIGSWLAEAAEDLCNHFHLFLALARAGEEVPLAARLEHPALRRYSVNVMDAAMSEADGAADGRAPVVEEADPTFANLIGRIEHMPVQGALLTDFTLIKPGALHRANGGFLILEARDVLMQPFAWEGLKRCLKSGSIRLGGVADRLSLVSTVSLEPQEIPLSVKVVLLGDRELHDLLSLVDPDFATLFKVFADFDDVIDRSRENAGLFACLVADHVRRLGLPPFGRDAVAEVLGEATRLADDAAKFTLRVEPIADLMREAAHWAAAAGAATVGRDHVRRAVEEARVRSSRLAERTVEMVARGIVTIDTDGEVTGQVNGLSVVTLAGTRFGRPSRITARARMGSGRIIDIEREVKLGGPLHSKGVLILSGFLAGRFGAEAPVSLSASLVFEQSYGGVDGDSASSAELYALLSAISGVPLRQSLAVTGSVDQFGRVQAIGGVNEKIEGFFDVCARAGLTGRQGVLIPAANVQHLNLREDVVAAAAAGRFAIWPVAHVDEGIALLTGLPAGAPDAQGRFPEGSVNGRVAARLADFAAAMRRFGRPEGEPAAAPGAPE